MTSLEKLSRLLGVEVLGLYRERPPGMEWSLELGRLVPEKDFYGEIKRQGWYVKIGDHWRLISSSSELRSPRRLNQIANAYSRASWPPCAWIILPKALCA
jgi:hypothetical protein